MNSTYFHLKLLFTIGTFDTLSQFPLNNHSLFKLLDRWFLQLTNIIFLRFDMTKIPKTFYVIIVFEFIALENLYPKGHAKRKTESCVKSTFH